MDLHSIQAGRTLHYEQSVLRGVLGAFVALIIVNVFWVSISMFFDRFFPWISILQGILIGQAFRKYGLGLDWYVPLLAALVAILASITGSFLSALNLTGREFNTGAIALIDEISWHTIKTFLVNEFGVVGIIYGIFAGILAAYYAKRRLTRDQSIVFRKYKESKQR